MDGPWSENSDEISFTDDVARVNGLPIAKTARARPTMIERSPMEMACCNNQNC